MPLEEKTLHEHILYKGCILEMHNDEVANADGSPCRREFVRHPGGCAVLYVRDGRIPLVRQYRYAYGAELLEIPAGKLDRPDEDPAVCAARELREETGFVANGLISLGTIYPSPGYTDELLRLFLCLDAAERERSLDEGEFLNVEWYTVEEIARMIRTGALHDAKTIVAFLRYTAEYREGAEV